MKRWFLRIAVIISLLAVLLSGAWWAWRSFWAEDQLYMAMMEQNEERVCLLIRLGAPIDTNIKPDIQAPQHIDTQGKYLHWAAGRNASKVTEQLLLHGTDANEKDTPEGWRPLHYAVENNAMEAAAILLRYNADVDAVDNRGVTPLCVAVTYGYIDMAKLLINHGADPELKGIEGGLVPGLRKELAKIVDEMKAEKLSD